MPILWLIRSSLFNFCGGYTMTSFYNDAVRLGRLADGKNGSSGAAGSTNKKSSVPKVLWWGSTPPPTTLSQDARETIVNNEVACALALSAVLLAGGFFALLGGFASFMLEGPDGPQRYRQLKDSVRDVTNGDF
jgi:hypothetical protein